jgi:hypothetical protein
MDGLDDLMNSVQLSAAASRSQARSQAAPPAETEDEWAWEEEDSPGNLLHERESGASEFNSSVVENTVELLREFITDLADEESRDALLLRLNRIRFGEFLDYYLSHPDLAEYTVRQELGRMQYRAVRGGREFSGEDQLAALYESTANLDIWRLANQSLYADVVFEIQQTYLANPDLAIRTQCTQSDFHLDFDRLILTARGNFEFSSPFDLEGGKQVFASLLCCVSVDFSQRTVSHSIAPPDLRIVFDSDLRYYQKLYVILMLHYFLRRKVAVCTVTLMQEEPKERNKWFSKIGSLVDTRSQLLADRSKQIINSTGTILSHCCSSPKIIVPRSNLSSFE